MPIKSQFKAEGFLNDAAYTFDLPIILQQYENQFGNAENLTLNIEEIRSGQTNTIEPISFSEDGLTITINITSHKFTNSKGETTGIPSVESIYKKIHSVLKKAVKDYKQQFPSK